MPIALIISLSFSIGLLLLSILFKVSGKLRLTIPLIYFLVAVISTFFTDWTSKNEQLVLLGLYILVGLVLLSWIVSLIKVIRQKYSVRQYEKAFEEDIAWQIARARELGIPVDQITVAEDGTVLDTKTNQPLVPISNQGKMLE